MVPDKHVHVAADYIALEIAVQVLQYGSTEKATTRARIVLTTCITKTLEVEFSYKSCPR